MTHLSTAPAPCHVCGRILFVTRAGLVWPSHYREPPDKEIWCVASGTRAPEVLVRAVVG